jgi:WD40 repeat protein
VRLWDVRLGVEVLTLKGHGGKVESLAFSHDGRCLMAGIQGEGRVHVWEVPAEEGKPNQPPPEAKR